jgi:hypothetical protein
MPGSMMSEDEDEGMELEVDELTQNFEEMTDLDGNTIGQRSVSFYISRHIMSIAN